MGCDAARFFFLRFIRIKAVFLSSSPATLASSLLRSPLKSRISFSRWTKIRWRAVAFSAVYFGAQLLLALVQIICWRIAERVEGHCTHFFPFYFLFISFQFCVYFSLFHFHFCFLWFLLLIWTIFMRWTFLNWQRCWRCALTALCVFALCTVYL